MINVIAIMGMPYCGSTLFAYQLGSLTNCAAIGELYNWAFRNYGTGKPISYGQCATCENCEHLTPEFREALTAENVYQKYSELFEVTNLIDGSKVVPYYRDIVFPQYAQRTDVKIIPVILYKSPLESCASSKIHEGKLDDESWCSVYEDALSATEAMRNRIILSYKDFVINNAVFLKYFCDLLGETYTPNIVEYWNFEHHHLGGNSVTHISLNDERHGEYTRNALGADVYEMERAAYHKKISYMEKHS